MSYDVVVFETAAAPAGAEEFRSWYQEQSEEPLDEAETEAERLRSFFLELKEAFPPMNGPHATEEFDNPAVTEYSFGPVSIYICFAWSQAERARSEVQRLAEKHLLGIYDISNVFWPGVVAE